MMRKVGSFDQKKDIMDKPKAARTMQRVIEGDIIDHQGQGVCHACTLEWLRMMCANTPSCPESRMELLRDKANRIHLTQKQFMVNSGFIGDNWTTLENERVNPAKFMVSGQSVFLGKPYGFSFALQGLKIHSATPYESVDLLRTDRSLMIKNSTTNAIYYYHKRKGEDGAHAVGFYKHPRGFPAGSAVAPITSNSPAPFKISFFDPNEGEYLVNSYQLPQLLSDINKWKQRPPVESDFFIYLEPAGHFPLSGRNSRTPVTNL